MYLLAPLSGSRATWLLFLLVEDFEATGNLVQQVVLGMIKLYRYEVQGTMVLHCYCLTLTKYAYIRTAVSMKGLYVWQHSVLHRFV